MILIFRMHPFLVRKFPRWRRSPKTATLSFCDTCSQHWIPIPYSTSKFPHFQFKQNEQQTVACRSYRLFKHQRCWCWSRKSNSIELTGAGMNQISNLKSSSIASIVTLSFRPNVQLEKTLVWVKKIKTFPGLWKPHY